MATLILLLAAPLGAPAFANDDVRLYVVLDSTELLASINASPGPAIATDITFEVFNAIDGGLVLAIPQTASSGVASTSFDLTDGTYKIRATAAGFLESWYTIPSGRDGNAFAELLGYQDRDTFATADEIVVGSATGTSSWNSEGWTVLHRTPSSISGAVAKDFSVAEGSMLANVSVELYDEAATDPDTEPAATTHTDLNGYYTFLDVAPGAYKVRFQHGGEQRWWPETPNRAEAEPITLTGANHFNLAYAIFLATPAVVDPAQMLHLGGEPAVGATLTASPDGVGVGWADEDCLQRYSWFVGTEEVSGAFGPTFAVPLAAGGKSVTARLDIAGVGCTYTTMESNAVGPVDPGLTISGANVVVAPVDNAGRTDVALKFADVGTPGTTTVTRLESGDAYPDGGFSSLTSPPLYYDIETTAVFSSTLGVLVCITFDTLGMSDDQAVGQHLYHYVDGAWVDITGPPTGIPGEVCGRTTSFSPFAVGQPRWPFRGFVEPVDNGGTLNAMKAGAAVPIKFGVGGNRGLDILAAGAPSSSVIACPGGTALDDIEQTLAAGNSSLSYAASSDTYTYVWKTQKAWAGTCRQFTLGLNDGTTHTALFDFRK
ncbi:carboxypeptidase-like regulatory domain-containing protein [Pseudarthrobacter sp. RMG13]|uniref:Carboxypeptidase-like regulatory domain-containing protein n=1 Tax=Pseudarthrobacter humi TaxID=2952523 RepID=A0ABT1LMK6_9MICC|nr:PxKF domain-containing protein [Pseudarthrobacter humi]MCP8999642.1 carboxypeptidase-like regulatory domain-containing protein [Pseudarthrobacter humi]